MKELQTFTNAEFGEIEVIQINEKEFFPATEVAKLLGYQNPHDAILKHCKDYGVAKCEVIDKLGRTQEKKFIDEGNLYRLIIRSKLPSAERFERWIFEEVIPTIRTKGEYAICTTYSNISAKERIQIARLVAFTPSNRLEAVKKILKPFIGDVKIENEQPQVTQTLIGDDNLILETMNGLITEENAVVKKIDDETFALNRETFKTVMKRHGFTYEQALKVLDDMGNIQKSSEGKRTCPVNVNGRLFRCVIYKVGN